MKTHTSSQRNCIRGFVALGSPCWQHHPEQAALKIGILPHLPVAQVVQVAQVAQLALVGLQMKKPVLFQVSRCPFPIISWSAIGFDTPLLSFTKYTVSFSVQKLFASGLCLFVARCSIKSASMWPACTSVLNRTRLPFQKA